MGDIDEIIFSGYVVFFLKQVCQNRLVTKQGPVSLLINNVKQEFVSCPNVQPSTWNYSLKKINLYFRM